MITEINNNIVTFSAKNSELSNKVRTFAAGKHCLGLSLTPLGGRGKSGQHRAPHF